MGSVYFSLHLSQDTNAFIYMSEVDYRSTGLQKYCPQYVHNSLHPHPSVVHTLFDSGLSCGTWFGKCVNHRCSASRLKKCLRIGVCSVSCLGHWDDRLKSPSYWGLRRPWGSETSHLAEGRTPASLLDTWDNSSYTVQSHPSCQLTAEISQANSKQKNHLPDPQNCEK